MNPNPVEVDSKLADLGLALAKHQARLEHLATIEAGSKYREARPLRAGEEQDRHEARTAIQSIIEQMKPLDALFAAHRWTRWFPCTNAGGHLHVTLGCDSLYATTSMAWRTDLSGRSVESVVAEFGTDVCSVCVPSAPSLPQPAHGSVSAALRELGRQERAAKREAKAAKVAANTLLEPIRGMSGYLVRTVTEARHELSHAIPYAFGFASCDGLRPGLKADADAAYARARAALVLKLGEEAVEDLVARAEKRLRREWAR